MHIVHEIVETEQKVSGLADELSFSIVLRYVDLKIAKAYIIFKRVYTLFH